MSRGATPASPEQTETESRVSETDQQRVCPLCEFDAGDRTDLYTHLQTSHRKSTLATAILDDTADS